MKKSTFKRTPHPPYSPDIAPSDFFLFGFVKDKLKGKAFKKKEDLFEEIFSIIERIPSEIKHKVFEEWAKRCKWAFSHEGLYFPN